MAKKKEEFTEQKSKEQIIEEIKKGLEKDYGKGTMIGGTEKPKYYDHLSTGSVGLDKALGIGGLPKGRIVEIYGPESSGKTTLASQVIAEAHKDKSSQCAYIDAEHALDSVYTEKLGVDLSRLQISQPDYGEQALEVARRIITSGVFDVVVIDSVAALIPKSELEGEVGEAAMGKQARMMSQVLRMMTAIVSKTNTLVIFINQMRDKIGVMFGSPETTTGGNALKFYASIRLDIRRQLSKDVKDKTTSERIGTQTTVRVVKNKLAPPFRKAEFDIIFGEGIDRWGEVLDMAVELGLVTKSGSFFSYEGTTIGQGREASRTLLKDNEELFNKIKEQVKDSFTPKEFVPTEKELEDGE